MKKSIDFYFDYISPNAYLAWLKLVPLAHQYDCEVKPVPVLFAGLLKAWNQMGPAEVPPKSGWMIANCLRKAEMTGVPLNPPASHPFNPLTTLRLSCVSMEEDEKHRLVDILFKATWVDGVDVGHAGDLSEYLSEAGFDADDLLSQSHQPEIKNELKSLTETALASGVFGVPTMVTGEELFFGYDDLPWLELCLQDNDPLDKARGKLSAWTRVRPSAKRS